MSDIVNPPQGPQELTYEWSEPEETWMNEHDGDYRAHREEGLKVLYDIKHGRSLSPRRAALAAHIHVNPNWEVYHELGMPEEVAKIMAEQMGTFLIDPRAEVGELSRIAELSDERATDQQITGGTEEIR